MLRLSLHSGCWTRAHLLALEGGLVPEPGFHQLLLLRLLPHRVHHCGHLCVRAASEAGSVLVCRVLDVAAQAMHCSRHVAPCYGYGACRGEVSTAVWYSNGNAQACNQHESHSRAWPKALQTL